MTGEEARNKKKFLSLLFGDFFSATGSGLTSFGLSIYVYQMTRNVTAMMFVMFLVFFMPLVFKIPSGVLANRCNRRRVLLLCDFFSAVGISLVLVFSLIGRINLIVIYTGVCISAVFSAIKEFSFRATVSDLLSAEAYAKAKFKIQSVGTTKIFLVPILAGILLTVSDINLLLIIDIASFLISVVITLCIKKGLVSKVEPFPVCTCTDLSEGWKYLSAKKEIVILLIYVFALNFFIGFIRMLSIPMVLAFSNVNKLGISQTVLSCGIFIGGAIIGIKEIKANYSRIILVSLIAAGVAMFFYGFKESIAFINIFGFLFFIGYAFANFLIEGLIRANVDVSLQRQCGEVTGIISQLGSIASFIVGALSVNFVLTPSFNDGGFFANTIGHFWGVGTGRACGLMFSISGIVIFLMAFTVLFLKKKGKSF